jgi:hypothetical protein
MGKSVWTYVADVGNAYDVIRGMTIWKEVVMA